MSERFPGQIDAVILALTLLGLCLFAPSCCSVRPLGVGFLGEIQAISPQTEEQWLQEIERECATGPASGTASASCSTSSKGS